MSEEPRAAVSSEAASATPQNPYLIPASIVLAGAFIAVSLYFSGGTRAAAPVGQPGQGEPVAAADIAEAVRPVEAERDHIKGAPDAKVTIIEYSDFQCPFCSTLHPTLEQIVEQYDGQVNWVYRHFPLTAIHPEAEPSARASECAAELGGNNAFWNFADGLFKNQTALGRDLYIRLATDLGINPAAFTECFDSGRHGDLVEEDARNAVETGGTGTPHGIVLTDDGAAYPIKGALPYAAIKSIVDTALSK